MRGGVRGVLVRLEQFSQIFLQSKNFKIFLKCRKFIVKLNFPLSGNAGLGGGDAQWRKFANEKFLNLRLPYREHISNKHQGPAVCKQCDYTAINERGLNEHNRGV